jgi:hypothetical protein
LVSWRGARAQRADDSARARVEDARAGSPGLKGGALLAFVVLALGPALWFAWPAASGSQAAAESGGVTEAHATWNRHPTLDDLMRAATTVVYAQVLDVESEKPITPEMANAPADKPSLPRERIRFIRERAVHGADPGETFSVVRVLPPTGSVLPEDPPYRKGNRYLLFLQRGQPLGLAPGWELVGLDGRIARKTDGRLEGYLVNGPAPELQKVERRLSSAIEESSR